MIPAAVEASLTHMKDLSQRREKELIPLLRAEERRLYKWKNKRRDLLESRIEQRGEKHPRARRHKKDLEELDDYLQDRKDNWQDSHFTAAREPSTQLILVIEGVD